MAVKFNPFTGQLQIDEKGSGGGSSYIDGEVAAYGDLSLDAGVAPLNSAWLVREASGTWLLGRKPAGIYIRTATAGVSRDADYTYAGILPDVFSDANFTLYDESDSTKNAKFQLSSIATGTTRTITVPDANITLDDSGDTRDPNAHAASHASSGSDPLFDQNLNTGNEVTFLRISSTEGAAGNGISFAGDGIIFDDESIQTTAWTGSVAASAITSGTLDIARLPTGTGSTQVALGNHNHTPSEVGLGNVSNTAQVTSVSGTAPIVSSGGTTPTISVTTGTTAGTVAAGDDSRITGAAQKSANLSDLASVSTARTNLGLAAIAASGSASDLTTGTVGTARLGTGTADNTTFLRGDGTWSAAGVSDGDKGDITVSNSGATWTIDANAVTNADLAQVATATIKGRTTAGTGNVEDLTASQTRGVLALATTDNVTFASLATSPAANTSALTSTGYSLTGSNAQSLVDLAGTWNTTGTPSAIKLNVTDTASNASSLLMQLQTGGTNRFTVSKGGALVCGSTVTSSGFAVSNGDFISNGFPVLRSGTTEMLCFATNSTVNVSANGAYSIGWASGGPTGSAADVRMWRDAAAAWALRDGTNAMEARVYGTFTSSTNYQRMTIKSVKQTLSALSGASATTTGTFIPDGAVVVGVTTRVATALTGAAGYTIGDGTDADRWGDITGTAIGTTSDNRDWTAGTIECFTAGGNITLTAKTSNFTAGAIEVCVFYLAGEAD